MSKDVTISPPVKEVKKAKEEPQILEEPLATVAVNIEVMRMLLLSLYTRWFMTTNDPHSFLAKIIEAMVTSTHNRAAAPDAPHVTENQVFINSVAQELQRFGEDVAKLLKSIDSEK